MSVTSTPEPIRRAGLKALEKHLGRAGMLQFLLQFDEGRGDYAAERRAWADATGASDIKPQLQAVRTRRTRTTRRTM